MTNVNRDKVYLDILLKRIDVCKNYRPKFGKSTKTGFSLQQFRELYGADIFYTWFGLDNPLMYAAHKAAGGITSVYRQIGLGGEELVRQIIIDEFELTEEQVNWSYEMTTNSGRTRKLHLDARIELSDVSSSSKHATLNEWLQDAAKKLDVNQNMAAAMRGIVIEVRQGYKSKDSKRQNADIGNASVAYTQGYLPINLVLSSQIDETIAERYEREKWLVLRGVELDDNLFSTYAFFKTIIGYDLADFFKRHSDILTNTVNDVLETLLSANDD